MKQGFGAALIVAVTAGQAAADVKLSMKADAGIVGGDDYTFFSYGDAFVSDGDTFAHADIYARISMRGETDAGWRFGASVALEDDISDSDGTVDDARVWVSGGFGTLSFGDYDGGLDWAMREANIGRTITNTEKHIGWSGNSGLDGNNDGGVMRYTYSWENFAAAASVEPGQSSFKEPVWGVGARYTLNHDMGDVVFGLGYQQTREINWSEESIWGVSVVAEFYNGFEAILNYSQYQFDNTSFANSDWNYSHLGLALGYRFDDWTVAVNWGRFDGDGDTASRDDDYSGAALVVNYDLGGGAEIQAGYGRGSIDESAYNADYSQWSLGISMVF